MRHVLFVSALALALSMTFAQAGTAQPYDVNVSSGLTAKGAPLALRGYDPVAYFEGGKPQLGDSKVVAVYGGATYQFSSKANLALFEKSPARYVPQYGGFCAYGVAEGAKFDGDPLVWEVANGKLYLNFNADVQKAWRAKRSTFISTADTNWVTIREAAPKTLKPEN